MALFFDIAALVNMLSIGTLLAYILVSASILILHYQPTDEAIPNFSDDNQIELIQHSTNGQVNNLQDVSELTDYGSVKGSKKGTKITNSDNQQSQDHRPLLDNQLDNDTLSELEDDHSGDDGKQPTSRSGQIVIKCVVALCITIMALHLILIKLSQQLAHRTWWTILLVCCIILLILVLIYIIARQPRNRQKLGFQVPFIPFLPILSLLVNIFLILKLPPPTWIRFAIWMAIGKY